MNLDPERLIEISVEVDYYNWLLTVIHTYEPAYDHYSMLLKMLYDMEYHYTIHIDDDRMIDGKGLRTTYERETGDEFIQYWDGNCSVLEMLVALAVRVDGDITGTPNEDKAFVWFWTFIENLGLMVFTDDNFDEDAVFDTVKNWMERKYKKDGEGGLFPVQNERGVDQRKLSTWRQLCQYIVEKYVC